MQETSRAKNTPDLREETIWLDERHLSIRINTGVEGALAAAATSPVLEVTKLHCRLFVLGPYVENCRLTVSAFADSLCVVSEGIKEADREKIKKKVEENVLETSLFSSIDFASTRIEIEEGRQSLRIEGVIRIHGMEGNVTLTLAKDETGALRGRFPLLQSQYGIKPLSALMGAIRAKDEVGIELTLSLENLSLLQELVPF